MRSTIWLATAMSVAVHGCTQASNPSGGAANAAPPTTNAAALVAPAPAAGAPAAAAPASAQPIYRVPIDGLPAIGDPRALVTVVAFTDYQCPFCKRAEATIAKLRATYGADLRYVVAERPLPFHDRARPAALLALAAAEQGPAAYEAARARLYAGPLDDAALTGGGDALANAALAKSEALADGLGIRGTPTFFVNGRRIVGAQPYDKFAAVVDERLAAARALVASGVRPEDVYAKTIASGADKVPDEADEGGGACAGDGECNGKHDEVGTKIETVPTSGAPARGSVDAPITVVMFSDFECPFSRKAEATIHAVEAAHPGDVRVVFKNLPLPMHDNARIAAKAALAADAQGRFWAMHDALFGHQHVLDRASIDGYAKDLGLDVARFDRDLDDPKTEARVAQDEADADALQVKGTPTFFVNGRRITGAQPKEVFEQAIAKAK
jgi:protein-disulfide isomerase